MERKKRLFVFVCGLLFVVNVIASFEQLAYERRVVIRYAAPGTKPTHANGFMYTIPQGGTFQVEIIPKRPNVAIKGLEVPIDVAVGILYEDPHGGSLRMGSKRYRKGPRNHGTGNTFATFMARENMRVRVWYSSSMGGLPSPEIGGKVRIFRIK